MGSSVINQPDSVNPLQNIDNPDLFYNQQLNRVPMTWELKTGSLVIRGLIDDLDLDFGIQTAFTEGVEDPIGKWIGNTHEQMTKLYPYYNEGIKVGDALSRDLNNAGIGSDTLSDVLDKAKNQVADGVSSVMEGIGDWKGKNAPNIQGSLSSRNPFTRNEVNIDKIARGKFISALEKVKIFAGSTISLPNFSLKTQVFHKKGQTNVLDFIKQIVEKTIGDTKDVAGLYGLQDSPNGYKPNLRGIGQMSVGGTEGTWSLRVGTLTIHNMLVENFNFKLRNMRALDGWASEDIEEGGAVVSGDPYRATLMFSVTPAALMTKKDLINLLNQLANVSA